MISLTSPALIVRCARPEDDPQIRDWMARCDASTAYQDPRWGEVIQTTFGHGSYYLLCQTSKDSVAGVLPLIHMKSALFGNFVISMPFVNYGGVGAEDERVRIALIDEGIRITGDVGADFLELRQESRLTNGLEAKTTKVSMRLPIPDTEQRLWSSFPSKLRSQIRGAQKRNLSVRIGKSEELDGFYEVFSVNMRDLGSPVLPKSFFSHILGKFPESTWIVTVVRGGKPVASGFLSGFKNRIEIPWASSLRSYNHLGTNMLLYWSCLSFACEKGFTVFDFGRSTLGESTYRFKEQWGAKPVPLYWHYWVRPGVPMPDITTGNPKYRLAINLWKRLPLPVTRVFGPKIVKNIP